MIRPLLDRRLLLSSALASASLAPASAWAAARTPYGGTVRIDLPLSLATLDPHDPHNLAIGLFGRALFEPLYGRTSRGQIYPTLATELPERIGDFFSVRLRRDLRFASDRALTADDVVASLSRCKKMSSSFWGFYSVTKSSKQRDTVLIRTPWSPGELAAKLSLIGSAIVPRGFSPRNPDGSGAFRAQRVGGELQLAHNPLAPRGGAFLDLVKLTSSSVSDSLRSFEATTSDLCLLGSGLYQTRKNARPLSVGRLGYALLLPNRNLAQELQPGELNAALAHLPDAPLRALGLEKPRGSVRPWATRTLSLGYFKDDPILSEIAKELKSNLAYGGSRVTLRPRSEAHSSQSSTFSEDLMLTWMTYHEESASELSRKLFLLDGMKPPKVGRIPPPEEAARQLRLGVLGAFSPRGAVASTLHRVRGSHRLSLETAYVRG